MVIHTWVLAGSHINYDKVSNQDWMGDYRRNRWLRAKFQSRALFQHISGEGLAGRALEELVGIRVLHDEHSRPSSRSNEGCDTWEGKGILNVKTMR